MPIDKSQYQIQSFAELLGDIGDRGTDAELTAAFNAFFGRLEAHAAIHQRAEGVFSLSLRMLVEANGNIRIGVEAPKTKVPIAKFPGSTYYSDFDDHGQVVLSKLNPKQRDMFEDTVRGPRAVVSAAKAKEIAP